MQLNKNQKIHLTRREFLRDCTVCAAVITAISAFGGTLLSADDIYLKNTKARFSGSKGPTVPL